MLWLRAVLWHSNQGVCFPATEEADAKPYMSSTLDMQRCHQHDTVRSSYREGNVLMDNNLFIRLHDIKFKLQRRTGTWKPGRQAIGQNASASAERHLAASFIKLLDGDLAWVR
jgi:hypothetical protein